ncbi:unnamed protein product [Eretmochelys imbricata]
MLLTKDTSKLPSLQGMWNNIGRVLLNKEPGTAGEETEAAGAPHPFYILAMECLMLTKGRGKEGNELWSPESCEASLNHLITVKKFSDTHIQKQQGLNENLKQKEPTIHILFQVFHLPHLRFIMVPCSEQ